ncbi:MAG: hypothetical protein HZC55_17690 [Verrucomicrobia bacterium]|nr:hypothetical protein [Verrucomicrobiota bacterium]
MDDELRSLEEELRALRPAPVPTALVERVRRELAPATPQRPALAKGKGPMRWAVLLPMAAALAVGVFSWRLLKPSHPVPAPVVAGRGVAPDASAVEAFKPVAARNVLYGADDEGLVILDDGTPARRERLHFVDTITWRNPRTNASLTWSLPREEVRLVPVIFQ